MIKSSPILDFVRRRGLATDVAPGLGHFTLKAAGRCRIRMQQYAGGHVMLEARIASMPARRTSRAGYVERLLRVAAARLRMHAEVCAFDAERDRALLRRLLPGTLGAAEFDEAVLQFTRALLYWKNVKVET
jgi:hypothetical protein